MIAGNDRGNEQIDDELFPKNGVDHHD
jgi:hypothetical protein